MSENMIKQGMTVQIRRTDGRMHPALVASVNEQQRCVTVEWFEKGETKGKEIEFDIIYALNTDLISNHHGVNNVTLEPQKLARESSTSWDEDEEEDDESQQEVYATDCDNGNVKNKNSMSVNSLPNPRTAATKASVPAGLKIGGRQSKVYTSVNNSNTINNEKNTTRGVENIPPTTPQQVVPSKQVNNTFNEFRLPENPAPRGPRKSRNVVKEVEKLKKNREERRQRQAEKKNETKALMNVDPGNPNWQFLNMIREFQSVTEFRPLRDSDPVESHQITVCVRKRPLNKKENMKKEVDVISVTRKDLVVVHEPKHKVDLTKYLDNHQFRFDYAFDETCSNETVYKFTAKPLVQTVFEGGMATCFAYGQTGSGKTHTMGGTFTGKTQDCNKGIYAMVAKDVFQYLHSPTYKSQRFVVSASFFEIYSGKVFDLLNDKAKLRVLEDGKQQIQIVGMTEKVVDSVDHVLLLITSGNQARTSGQTSANSNSSRSHAVFQITLRLPGSHNIHGKFSLIDLAGNERGADTSSSNRLTRMEGAEINKSLLALKECIRALGRKGAHLPFRASKLTQVLRDSFISDNTKTCMIAMISPGMSSCEHTLNTLRYADRVKELAAIDSLDESLPGRSSPIGEELDESNRDDLAALRSLNEGEISTDLLNLHEALSHLQNLEDDVLDGFKAWRDSGEKELELVEMARQVDYDQDAFATLLDNVLGERAKVLESLREKVKAFRNQLVAEEEMSKRVVHDDYPGSRRFN